MYFIPVYKLLVVFLHHWCLLTYSYMAFKKGIKIFLDKSNNFCLTVTFCDYDAHCLQFGLGKKMSCPASPDTSLWYECAFNVHKTVIFIKINSIGWLNLQETLYFMEKALVKELMRHQFMDQFYCYLTMWSWSNH